jgi:hypothetical protein
MARSRNIKPGFFKNEALAECSPLARLLFAGLWCLADRVGRLEDRPKRIRAELLPYDDGSVDNMLDELHRAGFILRYQHGEQRFIQVLNFAKHQHPHVREPESEIPAPDMHQTSTVQEPDAHQSGPADSLILIPDSLKPEVPASPGASAPLANPPAEQQPIQVGKSADPVFGDCLQFLVGKGCAEKGARSFLGLMRKTHGDVAVVQAIEHAEREDICEPIPWLRKYLEGHKATPSMGGISEKVFA